MILPKKLFRSISPDDAPIEDYIRLEALDGSERELSDADILITQNLSEVMDFSVGDDLHIQNSDLEECDFPISGIVRNYLGNAIYIRQSRYEALIGSGSYAANSILAHLSDSCTDPVAYADQLSRESDVVSCNSVQAMRDEFFQILWIDQLCRCSCDSTGSRTGICRTLYTGDHKYFRT